MWWFVKSLILNFYNSNFNSKSFSGLSKNSTTQKFRNLLKKSSKFDCSNTIVKLILFEYTHYHIYTKIPTFSHTFNLQHFIYNKNKMS